MRQAHPYFHTPESKVSLGFSPPWVLPTCETLGAKGSPGQVPPAATKHLREQAVRRLALQESCSGEPGQVGSAAHEVTLILRILSLRGTSAHLQPFISKGAF